MAGQDGGTRWRDKSALFFENWSSGEGRGLKSQSLLASAPIPMDRDFVPRRRDSTWQSPRKKTENAGDHENHENHDIHT